LYYKNGLLSLSSYYKNDKLDGCYEEYSHNGEVETEYIYIDGNVSKVSYYKYGKKLK
jgi:antitoxin component YwqK of YwqJK toxin-antitoxin module